MGWTNAHLHSFTVGDIDYGTPDEDSSEDEVDEASVTVLEALGGQGRVQYIYDFGDDWRHEILIEEEGPIRDGLTFAVCVDGENACPPEDCGGPPGYEDLREALADPSHDEHEEFLGWVGGSFDPSAFDIVTVNADLRSLR